MQCKAKTKKGTPCKAKAVTGTSYCHVHGFRASDAVDFVSAMSAHMISLGALKARVCLPRNLPTHVKQEMKRLEASMYKTLKKARSSNAPKSVQARFLQESNRLHGLMTTYCIQSQRRRSYEETSSAPSEIEIPVATPLKSESASTEKTLEKVEALIVEGNRGTVESVLRSTIETMWAVVKRIGKYAEKMAKSSIQFVVDFWGLLLFIVLLAAATKKEWVINTLPKELRRLVKETLKFMMKTAEVMEGKRSVSNVFNWKRSFWAGAGQDVGKEFGAEAAKEIGKSMDALGARLERIVIILCGTFMVSTVLRIVLNHDTWIKLPKLPKFSFKMPSVEAVKDFTKKNRVPLILLTIFGGAAVVLGLRSDAGQEFVDKLMDQLKNNKAVQAGWTKGKELIQRALSYFKDEDQNTRPFQSTTPTTAYENFAVDGNDEGFYDAFDE